MGDVYMPADDSPTRRPVVVFLHGGGWRRFDRHSASLGFFQNVGHALAQLGFIAVLPSYRKSLKFPPWLFGLFGATVVAGVTVLLRVLTNAKDVPWFHMS